jgi:hypothetical protein
MVVSVNLGNTVIIFEFKQKKGRLSNYNLQNV